MDLDFVQKLIEFVSRSPIAELEIERNGVRIRMSRQGVLAQSASQPSPQSGSAAVPAVFTNPASTSPPIARYSIRAPLTGVFYRSGTEGEPPLASVGDVVVEGQKVGVLEAMKTFNVVESDRAGRIVQIAFDDHAAVQSGDVLFVLEDLG
ncbi:MULTISPECIES: acetyl-CoA carboxylase biotin carboxyl carrier protein subunit [unclassified Mesorhizobium]|uniref:acetyl-CoA carboxylase biotin carboxyl carrier protein n=1 Tax=unclassified Mesorhizobium TaxID=325217 RepID=UPI000FCAAD82|nr:MULTISPECIES: acetyl-CoA carboxylase biotin carboxyl carrier protein subunit [unclassified Mesorhizobium]RVD66786.1 acetyl-CoA carboxylase biotin carboxyl carrier protein subunit [Mesorhizobium sp. M7A.F.Ca.ET.027.03.2.1]RWN19120.1 MAG: acetyl-CoA carboxylase biotin carboxyl carrier protein subunit [Mesorhizobium sp.]RWP06257.1 MAG: acetyl-CoA carboxylase biotin carboxyl carrier protein subunit [Mesorhizobium sp.]